MNSSIRLHFKSLIIAVDFDGTIVTHAYPKIGNPIPHAIEVLRELQQNHRLVLWTCRMGKELEEAHKYCADNGLIMHRPEEVDSWCGYDGRYAGEAGRYRKVYANLYIDDKSTLSGCVDWKEIYRMIRSGI